MTAMLKHQRLKNSGSTEVEPKESKYQRLDKRDIEERNGLDEDENEIKGARYVSFPLISLFSLF